MKSAKKILALAVSAMMLVSMTACGSGNGSAGESADNNSASGEAFKIGGIGPLTGGAAIYGTAAKNGAQIAVDEINAKGGVQFELNFQDDEHDAEKSVNAYNKLKDWVL